MDRRWLVLAVAVVLCWSTSTALAQEIVAASPTCSCATPVTVSYGTVSSGLVTSYYPMASVAAPAVAYSPVVTPVTSYYAPPAVSYEAYSPVVSSSYVAYSLVVSPYVAYSPVVTAYPAPYVAYRPAIAASYAPAVVAAGPAVVVRPKVYVRGEPVRNLIRAITP